MSKRYNSSFSKKIAQGTVDCERIIRPNLMLLMGDITNKSVIDIGCGSGRFSRLFAEMGAKVVGVDRSDEQLEIARTIPTASTSNLQFLRCDILLNAHQFKNFDIALLAFVVLDTPNQDEVLDLFRVANGTLRDGGDLVVVDLHPHNFDRENKIEHCVPKYRDSYFSNGAVTSSFAKAKSGDFIKFEPNFHYRLDFLLNSLTSSGFSLTNFNEPEFVSPFPTHMIMKWKKGQIC